MTPSSSFAFGLVKSILGNQKWSRKLPSSFSSLETRAQERIGRWLSLERVRLRYLFPEDDNRFAPMTLRKMSCFAGVDCGPGWGGGRWQPHSSAHFSQVDACHHVIRCHRLFKTSFGPLLGRGELLG